MNKKRILISLMLCSALALNATNLSDMISTYKSSAGSWTSPSTGMKYHYGGTYEFTFKGSRRIQPWVTAAEPSLKVGCNGVSLKGGFVGLLGLSEIKDQISDAGASLAWGAMIALQYAVPALFQVFNEIRSWAATIQSLLQNACNIGTMMVMQNDTARKGILGVENYLSNTGVGSTLTTAFQGAETFRKEVDNYVGCAGLSSTPDAITGLSPSVQCGKSLHDGKKADKVAAKTKISTARIFDTKIVPPSTSPDRLTVSKLSTTLASGKIGSLTVASGADLTEIQNTLKILRVFFGDITLSATTYQSDIVRETTAYDATNVNKAFEEGSYNIDKEQIKIRIKTAKEGEAKTEVTPITFTYVSPVISDVKAAAQALIHGITKSANTEKCSDDGYCVIDDAIIYYYDFSNENKERTVAVGIVDKPNTTTSTTMRLEWKGAYIESLSSIRTLVKSKTGYVPTTRTIYDGTGGIDSSTLSTTAPLLVPNIEKHIEIIAKLEKSEGKETPTSAYLKDLLARKNAMYIGRVLLESMLAKIIDANASGGTINDITEFNNSLVDRKNEIENAISQINQDGNDFTNLNEVFLTIDQELQNQKVKKF